MVINHYRHVSYDCTICIAGAFSRVFKGSFKQNQEMEETESIPVAIKTIKSKIY